MPAIAFDRFHRYTDLEGWDGFTLRVKKIKEGLDLNRNFSDEPDSTCRNPD